MSAAKTFLFWIALVMVSISSLLAQSFRIDQQVISPLGGSRELDGKIYSYTLGETAVRTLDNSPLILTQGFHQPLFAGPVSGESRMLPAEWGVRLFPNPASMQMQVELSSSAGVGPLEARILDGFGRMVLPPVTLPVEGVGSIDCRALPAGSYWLLIRSPTRSKITVTPFIKVD